MQVSDFEFISAKIEAGSVCVLPTDTVYGLIATTDYPAVVERIYAMKGRTATKPFIILISDTAQLQHFFIQLNEVQQATLNKVWPGPVSVILPCHDETLAYLHRGYQSLAFRIPKLLWLQELVKKTGPIIATSANKSGLPISNDLNIVMKQLPKVDFYIEGPVNTTPSKLARLQDDGKLEWLSRS